MATKIERFTKWLWFDWVIFFMIVGVACFVFNVPGGFIGGAIVGVIVGIAYSLTLKRLWAFVFPDLYREWVCSKCRTVISEEAAKCSKCGAQFGEEQTTEEPKGSKGND
jgi:ribosomal protein L37AE/L43A